MAKKRKKIWGINRKRKRKTFSKQQLERMSKRNAYKVMTGTDNLKSWGKSGHWKSTKLNEWFSYRSNIELETLKIIDKCENIVDFDVECFCIPYNWGGVECRYIPDIILKTKNGNVFVVEVKPESKLNDDRNRMKFKIAKNWCWENGCRFIVITEKDNKNLPKILSLIEDRKIDEAQSLMRWNIIS